MLVWLQFFRESQQAFVAYYLENGAHLCDFSGIRAIRKRKVSCEHCELTSPRCLLWSNSVKARTHLARTVGQPRLSVLCMGSCLHACLAETLFSQSFRKAQWSAALPRFSLCWSGKNGMGKKNNLVLSGPLLLPGKHILLGFRYPASEVPVIWLHGNKQRLNFCENYWFTQGSTCSVSSEHHYRDRLTVSYNPWMWTLPPPSKGLFTSVSCCFYLLLQNTTSPCFSWSATFPCCCEFFPKHI